MRTSAWMEVQGGKMIVNANLPLIQPPTIATPSNKLLMHALKYHCGHICGCMLVIVQIACLFLPPYKEWSALQ
jgi:hypothetical protein